MAYTTNSVRDTSGKWADTKLYLQLCASALTGSSYEPTGGGGRDRQFSYVVRRALHEELTNRDVANDIATTLGLEGRLSMFEGDGYECIPHVWFSMADKTHVRVVGHGDGTEMQM